MFVPFCNLCNQPGSSPAAMATRRFNSLKPLLEGHTAGLEIIPLTDGQVSQDTHLCDTCFAQLILAAVGEADPMLTKQKKQLAEKERNLQDAKAYIAGEHNKIADEAAVLELRKADLAEREKYFSGQIDQRDVRIKVLEAQVVALQTEKARILKQATAQASQLEQDQKNYPDYVSRVDSREEKRSRVTIK